MTEAGEPARPTGPALEVCEGAEAAARRAAELIAEAARDGTGRGAFSLAVSGGQTPSRMLGLLDSAALLERGAAIFQVDERIAPDGDPDRNLTALRAALPADLRELIHPMPVLAGDLEAAAAAYATELPESLDLVHLGLGEDGHTASLVPGDPVLRVADRRVALTGGEYQGRRRMTLTYPALEGARRIIWLVTGAGKREALARLLSGDPAIPAGRVRADRALVVCDREAAPPSGR